MPPIDPNSASPSPLAGMLVPAAAAPIAAPAATPTAQPVSAPTPPVEMFTMDDVKYLRGSIFNKVKDAAIKRFPVENVRYALGLENVRYSGSKEFTKKEQKDALLKRKNLTRALKGTWTLTDRATGEVIDRAENRTIAQVPYLTERGTFIRGGNEYTVSNQSRLRAGAYNRRRVSGELETHFNVLEGGRPFRVVFDPQTEKLTMQVGGAKLDLATVLKGLGKSESDLRKAWGDEIYVKNSKVDTSMTRAMKQFGASRKENEGLSLAQIFAKMKLDPEITLATLKKGHEFVDIDTIMASTRRLLAIARKEEEEDDRDSIAFQRILGPDDLFSERIALDYDRIIQGRMLWNSTRKGQLSVESGALTKLLDTVFTKSGLSQPLEEVNPIETLDQAFKLVRTGEGGISGDGVPAESRNVQGTHFGIIDPVRGPESGKIGLDSRFAINVRRGSDGGIYTMLNNRAGKLVPVSAKDAANSIIAFPGELASGGDKVRAMVRGKISYVDAKDVKYEMKHASHMFTVGSNLVPMISSTIGSRLLMGAKFYNQALPVRNPEAPYVQGLSDDGDTTFESIYGGKTGVIRAEVPGRVIKVTKDAIHVNTRNGVVKHDLYDNFPFNRKTFLSNVPQVQMGDHVSPGQVLASTNFTNAKGSLALGKNLRTAYLSWKGANFEDAVVISQEAADKMSSEHLFSHKVDNETHTQRGKKEYLSLYPGTYTKDQYTRLDEDGVIRVGQTVSKGDPLILAVKQKPLTDIHRGHKPGWADAAEEWEREAAGVVTDVEKTPKGVRISIRSFEPMKVGDKIVGRFGDKGIIADIVPDGMMPHGEDGKPYEVLLNPLTVVSRTNPSQVIEAALGKIAAKTGKVEKIPGFMKGSVIEYAVRRLKEAGLSDTENLSDPQSNRKFRDTLTGSRFFMKLHHMSEDKVAARNVGGYTSEDTPARGGHGGGKQMGTMDINALLSHGATEVLKDAKTIRGQKNTEFWKAFQMGRTPPSPEVPMVYKKFLSHLKGAGINLRKSGGQLHVMALTDVDVDKMSAGAITEARGVDLATLKEVPGGLFDKRLTGGHDGDKWSHINLEEPIPNPVMEEPIRRMLGITQGKLEDILSGKETLNGRTGGAAILEALRRLKVPEMRRTAEEEIRSGAKSRRDDAIKLMGYIKMLEKTKIHPRDFMMTKVPVIPPKFRPISSTEKFTIVADANKLYIDLLKTNEALRDVKEELGTESAGDERLALYNSFKAVTGLGDPLSPKLKSQRVRGLLGHVFGRSPKMGMFQRRVLGGSMDFSGRAVISPNPSLDMDHVGLPEDKAWDLYQPFIMRKLTRAGMPPTAAVQSIKNRSKSAKDALMEEMETRPILINRAPTLHRYNIMAVYPTLVKGNTLQVNPAVTSGFNADFDGDAMQFHVPVSDKAVQQAKDKMLPSKNLFATGGFNVHYLPTMEYQYGLYLASSKKSKREPTVFANKEAAIAAYRRGEIDAADRVVIR